MTTRLARLALLVAIVLGVTNCDDCEGVGPGSSSCCKVCKDGKACGDSCIAKTATCNQPSGCACNGLGPDLLEE